MTNKLTRTCIACPSQWEGTINDTPVYIRYRWGKLSVTTNYNPTLIEDSSKYIKDISILKMRIGNDYEGFMTNSELENILKTFDIVTSDVQFDGSDGDL